ncbi:AAA family ATPase [Roseibium sp. AS2]|uniref:ATP-binding protein n=1 Tax=Roseibium sp. AS2 TaxID=3135781 RepID=UPI00316F2540
MSEFPDTPGAYHAALTVVVIGFGAEEAIQSRVSAEEFKFISGRLATACAVAASEYGGKLVARPGCPKVLVFGIPALHELDAERAVLAAQKILRTFGREGYSHPVSLRCGIASGEGSIVLGQGPNMAPLSVTGSAFATAAWLESEAPDNELLISTDAQALFRSDFMARKVRLSKAGDTAFQVSPAVAPTARTDPGEPAGRLASFTGREEELRAMHHLWQVVKEGTPQTAILQGEPGIGKSSLIEAFLTGVRADHPLVLSFFGSVHHKRTPYYSIARGLYTFLGLKGFQSPTLLNTIIEQLLADIGLDTARHNANLRAILKGGGLDSHPVMPDSAVDDPAETLIACIRKLAAIHPVILVYEDAHWMDISTLESIVLLQRALDTSKVLTLVSKRPGEIAVNLTPSADLTCRVGQLCEDNTRQLAGLLRPEDMDDDYFEQVVSRSDGIPLFLEELMHNAADRGVAEGDDPAQPPIPASLRETLAVRLSHLGDRKDILFMAAAIGKDFGSTLLRDVSGLTPGQLAHHLDAFRRSNLIFRKWPAEDGIYEFKHSLVQDLAYQSIPPQDRVRYHGKIAAVLTTWPERYPPAASEVIARHFERAGNIPAALDHLEIAGVDAVRVAAHRDAGRYFGKALDLAQKLSDTASREQSISRFLLLLGPQLITKHGFASDQVREVYTKARTLTSTDTSSAEVLQMLWGLWGAHIVKADVSLAKALGEDFLQIARANGNPLELAAGHYMNGVGSFYVGDLAEAERSLLSAVEAALEADFDDMITNYGLDLGILARSYLAWCYALMNSQEQLRENCLSLETAALLSDHAFCQAFSGCFLATAFNFQDNSREAERHAATAASLCREQGFAQQLAQAEINLGRARAKIGDPTGLALMEHGLKAYASTGAVLARPYAEAWIAEELIAQDARDALRRLVCVRRFTLRSGERYFDAELQRLSALATGSINPGSDHLVRALLTKSARHARRTGNMLHLDKTRAFLD